MNYKKALNYATKMHETTPVRKGNGDAFITHPVAVAELLHEKGFGTDVQIMGLFHDLLEDTLAIDEEIVALGSREILEVVKLLTKENGYTMDEYMG